MIFSKNELDVVYQYAAPTKEKTLEKIEKVVPKITNLLTRSIVENTARKLERIPEPECSRFIAGIKAQSSEERKNSIRRQLAAVKSESQEPMILGHDLLGKERFLPETCHMVLLEVQRDGYVGLKGEQFRFFLSEGSYQNAKYSEKEGEIKIKSHAKVVDEKIYPDNKVKNKER